MPNGGIRPITWNRRPKNASLIASSETKSSARGATSWSQSSARAGRGGSWIVSLSCGTPSAKRKPYCATQGSDLRLSNAGKASNGASGGALAGWWLQLARRAAVTMLAVSTASGLSPWRNSTSQCWLERLARVRRTWTANSPRSIGAQKLTVTPSGSPSRAGCSSTARSAVAAEVPPNGPMKVQ
ncbi:MAG TPA: hypothetical protein VGK95_11415 [Caldimonas sp.]